METPRREGRVLQEPSAEHQLGEEDEGQGGEGRFQDGQAGSCCRPQGEACGETKHSFQHYLTFCISALRMQAARRPFSDHLE